MVELLITVGVVAVLLALAAPSFTNLRLSNRLLAGGNELVAMLQTAKMEAVRRRARVTICPSADKIACGGGDWSNTIAFVDKNRDLAVSAGEEVIRVTSVDIQSGSLKVSPNVATNNRIGFTPDGFAIVGNAGAREGALSLCFPKLPTESAIDVSLSMVRIGAKRRDATAACTAPAN